MTSELAALLKDLELFGDANDISNNDRSQKMLNITRDTGEFLLVLVNAMNAKNILEIGTSNGYSTLWLTQGASKTNGQVKTIEYSEYKISLARENFLKSGLQKYIQQIHGDAAQILDTYIENETDFIFLDSNRSDYINWWPHIKRSLRTGGLLVVDNAISHAAELESFIKAVREDDAFITSLLPIGKGEFLASKV
ncbi:MAG: methyltransferase domain-containing protein [Gammaproteobacteria bacterium]|nr:MAG: methyltransferase domain-containing protein [Gammaproteobacteria bacterium]